nr:hypothetical protein [Streptomyces sp. DSM 41633]
GPAARTLLRSALGGALTGARALAGELLLRRLGCRWSLRALRRLRALWSLRALLEGGRRLLLRRRRQPPVVTPTGPGRLRPRGRGRRGLLLERRGRRPLPLGLERRGRAGPVGALRAGTIRTGTARTGPLRAPARLIRALLTGQTGPARRTERG